MKRKKPKDLVPLTEVRRRLLLIREEYEGIKAIPMTAIVGSVDRSAQFDRRFRPRVPAQRERARQIALAFPHGDFPPIKAYRVSEVYFVRDGHIRVAAARDMGVEFIDAEVTALMTDETIPGDVEIVDVIHLEQHRRLLAETELDDLEPQVDLRTSRPAGYAKLREAISAHGYRLSTERCVLVPRKESARVWYKESYRPSVDAIRQAGIAAAFPRSTEADLYLWLEERRRSLLPVGRPLNVEEVARDIATDGLDKSTKTPEGGKP